jgi:FKBP-type peptidyl-prolyl cis-trans isomerase
MDYWQEVTLAKVTDQVREMGHSQADGCYGRFADIQGEAGNGLSRRTVSTPEDGTIVNTTRGVQGDMTITTTTTRSIFLIAMTVAVLFSLAVSTRTSAADPSQVNQEMKKTESGLKYRDDEEGTGEMPKTGQTCIVHYTGWLWENDAKGKEFDSSKKRNAPFAFHVGEGQVIKGWDEGVATMKVGGKRALLIPSELGFGIRGRGGVIPPNASLYFEVELLGVMKKTDSGLEYRDIKVGDGPSPKSGQTCVVHYTGWLWQEGAKGKKFDSSVDQGKPFPFPVGRRKVIPGWDEGVATMKVGGKRELLIPADLGYGARGAGRDIPPNATLLFEVELLDIK